MWVYTMCLRALAKKTHPSIHIKLTLKLERHCQLKISPKEMFLKILCIYKVIKLFFKLCNYIYKWHLNRTSTYSIFLSMASLSSCDTLVNVI